MIPESSLSTQVLPGTYLAPDDIEITPLDSYSLGGIALQDPSQGLQVQTWHAWIDEDAENIWVESPTQVPIILISKPALTEVSLAFDQNMHPFLAFVSLGVASFWWWDSLTSMQTFTVMDAGTVSPRCTLDDKRPLEIASSDIILAYIYDGSLLFRAERDRYTVPYILYSNVGMLVGNPTINKVAMTNVNRLQFTLLGTLYG